MSDFIGESEFEIETLPRRFPEESFGFSRLRELRSFSPDELNSTLRDLIEIQRNVPEHRNLPQPRVFISHQRRDKIRAVTISNLAKKMGFDYWLDVHDPVLRWATLNPNPDPVQQSLIIAILVEMGLLNCSHVLAIVTHHTAGSLWVPYEYGRVKSISMFCPFASSLISRRVFKGGAFADYLRLGIVHRTRKDVESWMTDELHAWRHGRP